MATTNPRKPGGFKRRLIGFGAALFSLTMLTGLVNAGTANAWSNPDRIERLNVWSPSMGRNIPVQFQSATGGSGGNPAVYMLDGLRAPDTANGWDIETNAFDQFKNDNVNVVMPIGGAASFYSDWIAPSNFNGQDFTYMWETFLSSELPNFLADVKGVNRSGNAVLGISMGGSAALYLAAKHKPQFAFAGSMSGYLNLSTPGMPTSIRVAMLDAGLFNADSMWGPPWSPMWAQHDPFVFAEELRGLSLFISAASAIPDPGPNGDHPTRPVDFWNTGMGMGLEALSLASAKIFQVRLATMNIPATFSFPNYGIHAWNNWENQLWTARPQILQAVGR
ncbi:alpha/beta hydrolase [Tomitella biformata]|uniref:alpha/beta hydrolase n=1 Tax=Tomitella biformata TaxID=630403 RepID=UPI0004654A93|nr:alpha/beta hydrolase family protein [Tomitella biformata]